MATGTERWRPLVEKWAPEFGVPVDIAMRVMRQESGGRHYTKGGGILKSSAGAMGLMQLMPGTARALGVDPANPYENLRGGLKYLGQQYKQFGDWNLAVAAYNAGPGNVRRALRRGGPDNWRAYLPRETRGYEQAIMGGKPYRGGMAPVGDIFNTPDGFVQSAPMQYQVGMDNPMGGDIMTGNPLSQLQGVDPYAAGVESAVSDFISMIQPQGVDPRAAGAESAVNDFTAMINQMLNPQLMTRRM